MKQLGFEKYWLAGGWHLELGSWLSISAQSKFSQGGVCSVLPFSLYLATDLQIGFPGLFFVFLRLLPPGLCIGLADLGLRFSGGGAECGHH